MNGARQGKEKGGTEVPPLDDISAAALLDQAGVLVKEASEIVRQHRSRGADQRTVVERLRREANDREAIVRC